MNQNIQLSVSSEQLQQLVSAYIIATQTEFWIVVGVFGLVFTLGLLVFLWGRYGDNDDCEIIGGIAMCIAGMGVFIALVIGAPAFTPQAREWALAKIVTECR